MEQLISIIIPSANPDLAVDTVGGLLRQTEVHRSEIILVSPFSDKLSTCHWGERVKIVAVDNLYPPGKMRNLGAEYAKGEVLFFIDDDCIPADNWVAEMIMVLEHFPKAGAVGCRVVSQEKGFWELSADYALFSCCQYTTFKHTCLGAGAIAFKKKVFLNAGGFDETLLASEDWDICLKLLRDGWDCLFTPEVEVEHNHRRDSLFEILKSSYLYGTRSKLIVQVRHYQDMSWLAKLSCKMKSPWLYWMLIFPYALAVSLIQLQEFANQDKKVLKYFPVVLLSRLSYHFGVWRGLGRIS